MTPIFKKLNFKQHKEIVIVNQPAGFKAETDAMRDFTMIQTDVKNVTEVAFVLVFVETQTDIDTITPLIDKKLKGDGVVWYAYPKKTSKKYQSEINRDNGWTVLGKSGFEAVRQVAIDSDWSAIRFRKVEYIKTMSRRKDFAMTQQGKQKTNHTRK